jgi:hypothetical protein
MNKFIEDTTMTVIAIGYGSGALAFLVSLLT